MILDALQFNIAAKEHAIPIIIPEFDEYRGQVVGFEAELPQPIGVNLVQLSDGGAHHQHIVEQLAI